MTKMHDVAKKGAVKKGSAPFKAAWSNNRPLAHGGGLKSSPGGSQTQHKDKSKKGYFSGR